MPALQASTSRSDRGLLVLCRLRLRHHPRRPSLRSRRVIRRQPATCGWSGIVGRPKAIMNRPRFHAVGRVLAEQPIFDARVLLGQHRSSTNCWFSSSRHGDVRGKPASLTWNIGGMVSASVRGEFVVNIGINCEQHAERSRSGVIR